MAGYFFENGVVYGVVLYGIGVFNALNDIKDGQKSIKKTVKHIKNCDKRIAKSLESQGCESSNLSHSASL